MPFDEAMQIYIDHINEIRKSEDWLDQNGEMSLIYIGVNLPAFIIVPFGCVGIVSFSACQLV